MAAHSREELSLRLEAAEISQGQAGRDDECETKVRTPSKMSLVLSNSSAIVVVVWLVSLRHGRPIAGPNSELAHPLE